MKMKKSLEVKDICTFIATDVGPYLAIGVHFRGSLLLPLSIPAPPLPFPQPPPPHKVRSPTFTVNFMDPIIGSVSGGSNGCGTQPITSPAWFECNVVTIPVGGTAGIMFTVVTNSLDGGNYDTEGIISSSNDPYSTNNQLTRTMIVAKLDIEPGSTSFFVFFIILELLNPAN